MLAGDWISIIYRTDLLQFPYSPQKWIGTMGQFREIYDKLRNTLCG